MKKIFSEKKLVEKQWKNELNDVIRGASGGFLFGIPLLYTMEVWWIGSSAHMFRLLVALLLTFAIVFMLNRTAGFRQTSDIYAIDAAMDSVEAMAIGLVCTASMLILIQEITSQTPLNEALGKLIYESTPFTLGVALANQFLSGQEENEAQKSDSLASDQNTFNATFSDIGGTLIGAIIIAFNIAPTDEIPMITAAVNGLWLVAIMAASLLVSYMIVFAAGFTNQQKRHQQEGIFQNPYSETLISYLVSLLAACMMLVFFDKLRWQDPWHLWLSYSIILGLPATIGGAAGRLAI
ncbi:TIGR02587 family membrane protein [Phormidium sp. CLA17]|uniref:TIGR02587 family membrane protein n=1 Tax=Leptolyngbya sp. Cla-17 TaxID=2803751 RepID=UPI001490973B|nr:TIGR02587 family membrane protein [Leptolyngbya sp. Cla-17]MBM0741434.1 TIGR02587 family membrane protein [Leptolyngbya sp. Cla-17]